MGFHNLETLITDQLFHMNHIIQKERIALGLARVNDFLLLTDVIFAAIFSFSTMLRSKLLIKVVLRFHSLETFVTGSLVHICQK